MHGEPDIDIELEPDEGDSVAAASPANLDLTVEDDRYSRLRLIPWWDQELLRRAKVLVVGAGALGNEIVKNLALLGVGHLLICDMDHVENSNLSRSVLFRQSDEGAFKAEVIARAAYELNPDIHARPFVGNIVHDLGLGAFRNFDVIIAGLDNREARLHINQSCWKMNRPWVNGAIEIVSGVARVFVPPDGPCYECTMSALDFESAAQAEILQLADARSTARGEDSHHADHLLRHRRDRMPGSDQAPAPAPRTAGACREGVLL